MTSGPPPFLKQLGHVDSDALLERVSRKSMGRSAVIMHEGSAGENVALVLAGRVQLVARGVSDRSVVLAIRGPGELLGEMAALGGTRRTATATALENVEIGLLSGEDFRAYLREHPDAALVLLRSLVGRMTEATRGLVELATQDSVGRVARRLIELGAEPLGATPAGPYEIELTQDELARWTGTTRETVSRALRLMRQLGWVTTGHRTITVLDPVAVRARGGDGGTPQQPGSGG
jgi:CRP/FNR family transcriptional regulator, cyclic AMP receptor protein